MTNESGLPFPLHRLPGATRNDVRMPAGTQVAGGVLQGSTLGAIVVRVDGAGNPNDRVSTFPLRCHRRAVLAHGLIPYRFSFS
jgi:hypothetical protein